MPQKMEEDNLRILRRFMYCKLEIANRIYNRPLLYFPGHMLSNSIEPEHEILLEFVASMGFSHLIKKTEKDNSLMRLFIF